MGKTSGIQWTDATWNIAVGCTKVDADCKFCYMYRDGERYNYDAHTIRRTKQAFKLPLTLKEPSRIFTCSLTDFFHEGIDTFRHEAWEIIRKCPQHTFQILTKRPERILQCLPDDWGEGYPNVWLGTSIGSEKSMHRLHELVAVPAKVRFLSLEPLHGEIELPWGIGCPLGVDEEFELWWGDLIHWVIVGGESGNETGHYRYRPCKLEWIQDIVDRCINERIPVFVKQLGTHLQKQLGLKTRHGGDINEFPETLRYQQFPE